MTVSRINHPIIDAISKTLHGKEHAISLVYASLLSGGHVLLEDVPGVGKTTLAHAIAKAAGLPFTRLQCTNDLLASDILGVSVWNQDARAFEFHQGPIFTNVLVADEINRAPSKSQSALLEAMEEGHVSIDGRHYVLPKPFWVVATQNPTEHSGTNALPESQLDRFLIKVSLGYPDEQSEKRMLARSFEDRRGTEVTPQGIDILAERKKAQAVLLNTTTLDYLYRLVHETRNPASFRLGMSPRAALGLVALTKAWAYLHNRAYATPDDIREVFPSVAAHRIFPTSVSPMQAIEGLLQHVPIHP
jgi:MoxR-like ATPase